MRARILVLVGALFLALTPALPRLSQAGYLEPVVHDGMSFPLLRTEWLSLINFKNDWLASLRGQPDGRAAACSVASHRPAWSRLRGRGL